jgi:hypothetical protein
MFVGERFVVEIDRAIDTGSTLDWFFLGKYLRANPCCLKVELDIPF